MRALAMILLAALLSGCATATVCHEERTLVTIENTGWYLFNFIPIASGNPSNPNACSCRLFSKTVTLENNMKMLERIMRDEGATGFRDLNSFTTDEHILIILLKRHAYHTSAQLLKEPEPAVSEASF